MIFEDLIYGTIISIFGNPLLAGLMVMIWITVIGVAMGLSGETLVLVNFFALMIVAVIYIPINTIAMFAIPILGIGIGLFLIYRILAR